MKIGTGKSWFLLLIVLVYSSADAISQTTSIHSLSFAYCWNAKVYVGKTQYYGDISHDDKWEKIRSEAKLSVGGSLTKEFNTYFALTADLFFSRLRSKRSSPNQGGGQQLYLEGKYLDISLLPRIDLISLLSYKQRQRKLSVYFYLGLGYGLWNTQIKNSNFDTTLIVGSDELESGVLRGGLTIPIILAVNYRFHKNWSVFVDGQIRTITNDKLDNWSGQWKFDQLYIGNIGLTYNFNFKKYYGPKYIGESKQIKNLHKKIYNCDNQ